jgi:hypothetical protein
MKKEILFEAISSEITIKNKIEVKKQLGKIIQLTIKNKNKFCVYVCELPLIEISKLLFDYECNYIEYLLTNKINNINYLQSIIDLEYKRN